MANSLSRRQFASGSAFVAASFFSGLGLRGKIPSTSYSHEQSAGPYRIMAEVLKYRKIDSYANALSDPSQVEALVRQADRMHVEKLIVAVPVAKTMKGGPEDIRAYNDIVLRALKAYPGRMLGQFTVNPLDLKTSGEEIKRCVDSGMVGMKLFNHVKINNPSVFPIIEKFVNYQMIIHVHGESQLGVGGYRMKYDVKNNPAISVPEDFVAIAQRYPEAMFQYAHIGGGADWEYACKSFVNYPNIYVDTGGSNNEEFLVDFAVEQLGEDRVFFGCDGSFYQGIGKILASGISDSQKKRIFFDNYNKILKKSGNNVN